MKAKFLPTQNSKDSCMGHTGKAPRVRKFKGVHYLFLLLAALMLHLAAISQTITVDGNPGDWPAVLANQPIATFVVDLPQSTDNQFTEGTKDYHNGDEMVWSISPVGDKVNLVNGGAAIIDNWLYFFGDRTSSNGSAQIGFWVFQNGTSPGPGTGFSPNKTPGDLLVLSEFTNGGGVATIKVYKWLGTGSGTSRLEEVPLTQAQALASVSANASGFPVPNYPGWEYCNKENKDCGIYYPGSFFEGKVDLTGLLTPEQLCKATFLLETRQSFSLSAMLGDFIAGSFNISPDPPTVQAVHSCELGKLVNLSVENPVPSETYKWYSDAGLTNLVHTGTTYSFNITQNTTLWVTASEGSCEGLPSQVTATVTELSCSIINYTAPVFGQSAGSATVEVLVNGQPSNLPYTISWSHGGSTATVNNIPNTGSIVTITLGNCTTTCEIPATQGCPDLSYELGCNPVLPNEARVKADLEAHYGQGSVITFSQGGFSAGTIVENGCLRSQDFTVSYQDQYGNVESGCTVTYTWKEDTTAPEITADGDGGDLKCNPSEDAIKAALGSATAEDNCDMDVMVKATDASGNTGCYYWATRTFTAVDECGNEAVPVVVRVTWKVDDEAPVITADGEGGDLKCNPSEDAIKAALGSATAEDNCDMDVMVKATDASGNTGCYYWATRTFTAVDECGNEAVPVVVRVTWKVDDEAPVITADGEGGDLKCNPSEDAIKAALGSATAEDNCDMDVMVKATDASGNTGCYYWATRTFTAVDECGNEAVPVVVRVTWKVDDEAPVITADGEGGDLKCNPSEDAIKAALGSATAEDNCDMDVMVKATDASGNTGCYYWATRTFTAVDECGNEAVPVVVRVTWKVDDEAPVITADGEGGDLKCNPSEDAIKAALGSATAEDNCDMDVMVKATDASGNTGCYYWATRTFTAVDECGNEAVPVVVRVTWKVDDEAPVITADGEGGDLKCNPSEDAIKAALGSATAEDNCDMDVMVKATDASGNTGCYYWATRTFTAVDECGNEAVPVVVRVTWKVDDEAPVITADGEGGDLKCNPSEDAIKAALGSATAEDNCDMDVVVKATDASGNTGCYYWATRTFTAVDECGNEADAVEVKVTWKVDVDGPVLQSELADLVFACDADVVLPDPQFIDDCDGEVTYTYTVGGVASGDLDELYEFPEGVTEVCYTAVDACGNETVKCIKITIEPCVYICETAFGKGNGAICFLPTFDRWGWTNAITPGNYTYELWAAAGQCDTSKGTLVGSVDVVYGLDGYVSVTYNVVAPYRIEETHTYVGTTMFPQVKRGRTTTSTVAPGQYYNAGPFKNGQVVYVIAHAVVCGPFESSTPKIEASTIEKSAVIERLDNATELKVYPNPFSTRVAFEFVSGKDVNARLEIYNNVGQMITTLMDRPVEKGVLNRVEFTPSNITHGVLFYRLLLDDEVQNGKLLYSK
jgi:hypothetical protein